jgi:DNA modification methylase
MSTTPKEPKVPRDGADQVEVVWPGKYDDQGQRIETKVAPARLRCEEQFPGEGAGGRLFRGDNLALLNALCEREPESVDLMYIDPPFNTGARFSVRRPVGAGGERQIELPAYEDAWTGGAAGFLSMLEPRLRMAHGLLASHGSLYVHVDPIIGHAVKLLLDEVFGAACFQREIVWRIGWLSGFKTRARNWIRNHDLIFFYVKDPSNFTFNKIHTPYPPGYVRRDGKAPTGKGIPLEDVWNASEAEFHLRGRDSLDSIQIKSFSREKTGWATQKNESLLRRIIEASSNPGDRVADLFAGSGTTAVAAHELGREWLICDSMPLATQIARARMLDLGAGFSHHVAETDPAPTDALSSPGLDVERAHDERGTRVTLVGYSPLPQDAERAGEGVEPWSDWIEGWTVALADSPTEPIFEAHRGRADRSLAFDSGPLGERARESSLLVRAWDLCGRECRLMLDP